MKEFLLISQIVVSIILVVLVLLQARGTGFGRSMGGGGTSFTRRGLEKLIFRSTFVFVGLFLIISVLELLF